MRCPDLLFISARKTGLENSRQGAWCRRRRGKQGLESLVYGAIDNSIYTMRYEYGTYKGVREIDSEEQRTHQPV